jgi:hypothetical protein
MWGVLDYFIWALGVILAGYVLVRILAGRVVFHYLALAAYLVATLSFTIGGTLIYHLYGFRSFEYIYFYFFGDAILSLLLYLVVAGLFERTFRELGFSRYVRWVALLVLAGTVGVSYSIVRAATDRILSRFVYELQQNLYFLGVVLCALLWFAMRKLANMPTRLMQITLGLGMFLGAHAAIYAFHNMFPSLAFWRYIPPASWVLFLAILAHTFTTVPETARIETRLVTQIQ